MERIDNGSCVPMTLLQEIDDGPMWLRHVDAFFLGNVARQAPWTIAIDPSGSLRRRPRYPSLLIAYPLVTSTFFSCVG